MMANHLLAHSPLPTAPAILSPQKPVTSLVRKAPVTKLQNGKTALNRQGPETSLADQTPVTDVTKQRQANLPSKREAFDDFVGQSFYGQLIGSMRKTVGKPAYLHGGRAEEVFQSQMDQQLAEHMSDATADTFTGPMYDLFILPPPR